VCVCVCGVASRGNLIAVDELRQIWKVAVETELNLNSVNQLIFVMVKCGVLFEVRTEFLNNI
jgi:hypothetical protein